MVPTTRVGPWMPPDLYLMVLATKVVPWVSMYGTMEGVWIYSYFLQWGLPTYPSVEISYVPFSEGSSRAICSRGQMAGTDGRHVDMLQRVEEEGLLGVEYRLGGCGIGELLR
ncbi:hypothetical protein F2Q70_00017623 [Brassica cretica]|uniref:Uncharacterized protein n=1 Tax=Brassica cretica TaxID=69181 RepID=A0A8S9KRK4_BRACR|nr:hypothetical protein F2Q70_00017623 [Brassica cretica]KAF2596401.1 hypothetical protein F2Q68_00010562 [Brassica cretica]